MCRCRTCVIPNASKPRPARIASQPTFFVASGAMRTHSQSPEVSLPRSLCACLGVNL